MSEMEEKLGAILSNPQMMQQIRVGRNNRRSLPLRRFRIFPSCRSSPG